MLNISLAAFFAGNALYDLYVAAVASTLLAIGLLALVWWRERRIARFMVFSVALAMVMTGAALAVQDTLYIKIQSTLFNGGFAVVLLGGLMLGRPTMKDFFAAQFRLTNDTWRKLTMRWGLFFLAAAITNEFAWRLMDEDSWVAFKVFVLAPASGVMMLAQLPLTLRGRQLEAAE